MSKNLNAVPLICAYLNSLLPQYYDFFPFNTLNGIYDLLLLPGYIVPMTSAARICHPQTHQKILRKKKK
jgi:hypothetical protein